MTAAQHYKIVFTGTMGAGKTTAITAISEIPPVVTDVANLDQAAFAKETTTVGLDYGELTLDGQAKLLLYGTPGQDRFDFMWPILAQGALGVILLVDNSRPDPLEDVSYYLKHFREHAEEGAVVLGIGRTETHRRPKVEQYAQALQSKGWRLPILQVDVRRKKDVLILLQALMSSLEAGAR
ncbi:GTP-binding protein [Parvibium lacunae]|uniref:GTP-binding protein n=1 Tax=Parvibium lacunae TaxID=1888893 RepID=A0A368L0N6_9BURK|nr:ATP/GTP-binding protein [Parvibium lacunae]RCS57106.1 GTP-binding protein [Parvibium lacunae]